MVTDSELATAPPDTADAALPPPATRRLPAAIFLGSLLLSVWFTHLLPGTNDGTRYSLTKAVVTRHSLAIDGIYEDLVGPQLAIDKASFAGHTYCDKAPLGSFLGVPGLWIARRLSLTEYWCLFVTSALTAALPAALCAALVCRLALAYGVTDRRAAACAAAVAWGTNLFYWSTVMFSHALSACLVVMAFTILKLFRRPLHMWLAGLCAGLAVASDYYLFLLLPLFLAWVWSQRRAATLWFVFGAAVAGVLPAAYHYVLFGNPLVLPYRYSVYFGKLHATGLYGIKTPSLRALADILCGPGYGLFIYNPILLLAWACAPAFIRCRRADGLLCAGIAILMLLVNSAHQQHSYGYGWSWGPRYLTPIFPFVALFLIALPHTPRWRRLFACALTISVVVNAYIVCLYYLPPTDQALAFARHRGPAILGRYGSLNVWAQHLAIHRQYKPILASCATLVLIVLVGAGIWWMLSRRGPCRTAEG